MKSFLMLAFFLINLNLYAQDTQEQKDVKNTNDTTQSATNTQNEVTPKASSAFLKQALGIGLGQTLLFGDYADHGADKLAMDLFYQYRASYSFDFLSNFHTSTYKKGDGQKTDLTAITANIKGRLFDFDSFAPYLTGGLGLYWPRVTRFQGSNLLQSEKHLSLGFNAGIGADLQLNENLSFGLAAFYHQPFSVKQDSQASVNGSYMRLMATAFMHF